MNSVDAKAQKVTPIIHGPKLLSRWRALNLGGPRGNECPLAVWDISFPLVASPNKCDTC